MPPEASADPILEPEPIYETPLNSESETSSPGVIRFYGKPSPIKPLKQTQRVCNTAELWQARQEQLRREIHEKDVELSRLENENLSLRTRADELDLIVKEQDHELALLKSELEQLTKEKLVNNNLCNEAEEMETQVEERIEILEELQGEIEEEIQAELEEIEQDLPESESGNEKSVQEEREYNKFSYDSQQHNEHRADLQKHPLIFCVCGVRFTTRQNLREHIKYYSFGMNFRCTACGIRKHGLNQLRTHMRVTHGISVEYLAAVKGCRLCGKLFNSLSQLHEHRRFVHGGYSRAPREHH